MIRVALVVTSTLGVLAGVPATASADWDTTPVQIEKVTPNPQKGTLRVAMSGPDSSYYKDEAQLSITAMSTIGGKRVEVAKFLGTVSSFGSSLYDVTPSAAALKTLKAKGVLKTVVTVTFTPAGGNPPPSQDSIATAFRIERYPLAECDASQSVTGIPERKGDEISVTVDYAGQGVSCAHAQPVARVWAKCALVPTTSKGTCPKPVSGFRCKSSSLNDDSDSGADGGGESQPTITLTGKVSCKKPKRRTAFQMHFSLERPNPVAVGECSNAPVVHDGRTLSDFEQANTTCDAAVKVAVAHTDCSHKNGPKGRCVTKVLGYSCREERTSPGTAFSGTVTCGNGQKRVRFSYREG